MADVGLTERTRSALADPDVALEALQQPWNARRRELIGRLSLAGADALAVVGSMVIVAEVTGSPLAPWGFAVLPLYALIAKTAGLYDRDNFVIHKTTLDEAPALVAVVSMFVLFIQGVRAIEFQGRSHPFLLWGLLVAAIVGLRGLARFLTVRLTGSERVLVIGDAETTALVRRKLGADPSLNAVVVGRLSAAPGSAKLGDTLLGTLEDLPRVIEEHRVERVIVAPGPEGDDDVVDIVRLATGTGVRVAVLPRLLEVIGSSVEFDDLGGRLLLGVRGFGLAPSSRFLKRAFDIVVTTLLLVLLAPLLLAITLVVRLTSPGPVLFRQTRVGRHGRAFQLPKFRTMVRDAEAQKHRLMERNQAAPLFKIADDPRTTPVGRFLRRYSLDELPQLFNVLRGDMSLVGPRPLITEEDRMFSGWQRRRYHVAPGITGPWQILGSSRVPVDDMLTLDYLYCSSWSLWLDAKILARTIPYVLSRKSGEHQPEQR
jgi:exopolysaccharide biosynthesis polyprenyl glycosylphosphotransferase